MNARTEFEKEVDVIEFSATFSWPSGIIGILKIIDI